ncbi:ClpP/crotonase [Laetiporus sulphureus 93-53]|uniref:ClpP/crotonase n=1 Tax=Laetiporus sulphureus 93-53 TaxID=1314785 RepID=A0A165ET02_9APHY|nr:ClpP/crotonase [Laetiporus sulphureus 93-53]KZT07695.1 ClpP/crotonase [Laetiporus sulphureus 93-53]
MSYPIRLPSERPLVTVTHPTPSIWVLELHNGADSRINEELLDRAMQPALDMVERDWREHWRVARNSKNAEGGRGALIIVGNRSQHKFFSNGLDYDNIMSSPTRGGSFVPRSLNPFIRRLLTFPIPTVAAINGHTFAAAVILALCCDYRVMADGSSRNVWMSMNEIHFGAAWPLSFAAVVRAKVLDARLQRKIALEGHRFTPQEALEAGLVDHIVKGDTEAVIAKACEVADSVSALANSGAWGLIKYDLYRDAVEASLRDVVLPNVGSDDAAARARL